ncbi:MAG TPA: site-2 protease family protein [Chitinispirillaceae bacterium]|nr:site-2 protease family protein [Chitinispirillaceae bacterium]
MDISRLIIFFPVVLFSLTIHEFAHGWIAYKCGDDTAKKMGRLTMNPFKHLDPFGTLMMIGTYLTDFIPFGWAKPVPVDPRFFRNPKRDIMLVSLAGPVSNLLTAIAAVIAAKILALFPIPMIREIYSLLFWLALANTSLAIFNLLPFAPLDGSKILIGLLPDSLIPKYLYYSHYFGLAFIFLIVAESILKIKTISYLLDPLFGFFLSSIGKLFFMGAGVN